MEGRLNLLKKTQILGLFLKKKSVEENWGSKCPKRKNF